MVRIAGTMSMGFIFFPSLLDLGLYLTGASRILNPHLHTKLTTSKSKLIPADLIANFLKLDVLYNLVPMISVNPLP